MKQMWCAIMIAGAVATAGAQGGATDPPQQKPMDKPAAAGTVTLTGCLQADTNKSVFWLSDAGTMGQPKSEGAATPAEMKKSAKAETYRLNPASDVSLSGHVGHKVEITGTIDRSAGATARGTTGTSGTASAETKHLENAKQVSVTAVKHISPTCEPGKQ
jgi:hypothetical protein